MVYRLDSCPLPSYLWVISINPTSCKTVVAFFVVTGERLQALPIVLSDGKHLPLIPAHFFR